MIGVPGGGILELLLPPSCGRLASGMSSDGLSAKSGGSPMTMSGSAAELLSPDRGGLGAACGLSPVPVLSIAGSVLFNNSVFRLTKTKSASSPGDGHLSQKARHPTVTPKSLPRLRQA